MFGVARRFNLLVLEEREVYFTDWAATFTLFAALAPSELYKSDIIPLTRDNLPSPIHNDHATVTSATTGLGRNSRGSTLPSHRGRGANSFTIRSRNQAGSSGHGTSDSSDVNVDKFSDLNRAANASTGALRSPIAGSSSLSPPRSFTQNMNFNVSDINFHKVNAWGDERFRRKKEIIVNERGRLRLCSKTLIFEPDDTSGQILKFHFAKMTQLESDGKSTFSFQIPEVTRVPTTVYNGKTRVFKSFLTEAASTHFPQEKWSPNDKEDPSETCVFFVTCRSQYDVVSKQLVVCEDLFHAWRKHRSTLGFAPSKVLTAVISDKLHELSSEIYFDVSRFGHRELPLLPSKGVWVFLLKPLVRHRGLFQLSQEYLYFQPVPNFSSKPFKRIPLADIRHVFRRTCGLNPNGLEVVSFDARKTNCALFDFEEISELKLVVDQLESLLPKAFHVHYSSSFLQHMTHLWQIGQISTFHYLDYLNCVAGRSRNEFSQYPVFPWVIADYTSEELLLDNPSTYRDLSKPMGALNPQRLAMLQERMADMPPDEAFLYGSHYTTPVYVVHFLVRIYPECQLRLHGGRFDSWNRMFHSISGSWKSATSGQASFMELIPEFYEIAGKSASHAPKFLRNSLGITTGNGPLQDVEFPPWAMSDASKFISTLRAALESDYVSRHISEWIDLIFGNKQKGSEAFKSANMFHPLTYANAAVAVSSGSSPFGVPTRLSQAVLDIIANEDSESLLTQITEFGQTPIQLFAAPHPPRLRCPNWESAKWAGDPYQSMPWYVFLDKNLNLFPDTFSSPLYHIPKKIILPSENISHSTFPLARTASTNGCDDSQSSISGATATSNTLILFPHHKPSNKNTDGSDAILNSTNAAREKGIKSHSIPLSSPPLPTLYCSQANDIPPRSNNVETAVITRSDTTDAMIPHRQLNFNFPGISSAPYTSSGHARLWDVNCANSHSLPTRSPTVAMQGFANCQHFSVGGMMRLPVRNVSQIACNDRVAAVVGREDGCLRLCRMKDILATQSEKQRETWTSAYDTAACRHTDVCSGRSPSDSKTSPFPPPVNSFQTFSVSQEALTSITHLQSDSLFVVGGMDSSVSLCDCRYTSKSHTTDTSATSKSICRPLSRQVCHADTVTCLAFATANQIVVSGSVDQTCRTWKVSPCGLQPLQLYDGHSDEITCVAISSETPSSLVNSSAKYVDSSILDFSSGIPPSTNFDLEGRRSDGCGSSLIVSGDAGGSVLLWDTRVQSWSPVCSLNAQSFAHMRGTSSSCRFKIIDSNISRQRLLFVYETFDSFLGRYNNTHCDLIGDYRSRLDWVQSCRARQSHAYDRINHLDPHPNLPHYFSAPNFNPNSASSGLKSSGGAVAVDLRMVKSAIGHFSTHDIPITKGYTDYNPSNNNGMSQVTKDLRCTDAVSVSNLSDSSLHKVVTCALSDGFGYAILSGFATQTPQISAPQTRRFKETSEPKLGEMSLSPFTCLVDVCGRQTLKVWNFKPRQFSFTDSQKGTKLDNFDAWGGIPCQVELLTQSVSEDQIVKCLSGSGVDNSGRQSASAAPVDTRALLTLFDDGVVELLY